MPFHTPDNQLNEGQCVAGVAPQKPIGWSYTYYFVTYSPAGRRFEGTATATSVVSQQDAKNKAKIKARQVARLKMYSGTPPIGSDQLFNQW